MKMSHPILILPLLVLSLVACKSGSDRVLVQKPDGAKNRQVEDPLKKTIGEEGGEAGDEDNSTYNLQYSVTQDGWSQKINDLRYCIEEDLCLGIGPLSIFKGEEVEGFQGDVIEISREGSREVTTYKLLSKDDAKVWTSEDLKLESLLVQAQVTGSVSCDSTYLIINVAQRDQMNSQSRVVLTLERGEEDKVNYIKAAALKPSVKIDANADLGEALCKLEQEARAKAALEELMPDEIEEGTEEAENENAVEAELHGENMLGPEGNSH